MPKMHRQIQTQGSSTLVKTPMHPTLGRARAQDTARAWSTYLFQMRAQGATCREEQGAKGPLSVHEEPKQAACSQPGPAGENSKWIIPLARWYPRGSTAQKGQEKNAPEVTTRAPRIRYTSAPFSPTPGFGVFVLHVSRVALAGLSGNEFLTMADRLRKNEIS